MSLLYIRKMYGVPAKRGGRIEFQYTKPPTLGTIVGADGQYLSVRFDGKKHSVNLHPTWEVTYLGTDS
jgi:hypothetical protein